MIGGTFIGINLNYEVPMGGWTFLAGLRGEWSYSWMNLIPNVSNNLHDLNFWLTSGVRF